jgi:hypothetical protein
MISIKALKLFSSRHFKAIVIQRSRTLALLRSLGSLTIRLVIKRLKVLNLRIQQRILGAEVSFRQVEDIM